MCAPDGNALLLLHGDVLLEVPALDHVDGGEDHGLAQPEVLLLPEGDDSVVVTLQLLCSVDGLLVRRGQEEHGSRSFALLASGVGHLPAELVRVVPDGANLVLLDRDLEEKWVQG